MNRKFVPDTELDAKLDAKLDAELDAELDAARGLVALHYTSAPVNNTATCAQTNNRSLLFSYHSPTTISAATLRIRNSEEQEMSEAAKILVAMANSPCQLTAPSENMQQKEHTYVVGEPEKEDSEATISISSRSSEETPSYFSRLVIHSRPHKTTIVKHTMVRPPTAHDHVRLGSEAKEDGTVDKPISIGDSSDSSDSDIEHASDAARAQVHARIVKALSYPQTTQQDNRHKSQHKDPEKVISRKQQQETLGSRQEKPVTSSTPLHIKADVLGKAGAKLSPWVAKLYDAFLDDVVFRNLGFDVKSHRAGEHARKAFTSFHDVFGGHSANHSTMGFPEDNPKSHFAQRFDSFVQALHINNRKGISNIHASTGILHEVLHNSQIGKAATTPGFEGRKIPELSLTNQAIDSTRQSSTKQGYSEDSEMSKKHVHNDTARIGSTTQNMDSVACIAGDRREAKTHVAKGKGTGTGSEATNTLNGQRLTAYHVTQKGLLTQFEGIKKHNATTTTVSGTIKPQHSGSTTLSIEPNETIDNYSDDIYSAVEFDDHAEGNGGVAIDSAGADKSHTVGSGGTNSKKRAYYNDPDPFWRCHMFNKKR